MIDPDVFDAALVEVRALVQADGGDLVLIDLHDTSARLELILEDAECRECVMPRVFLEQVAFDMISKRVPQLTGVEIHDRRESDRRENA